MLAHKVRHGRFYDTHSADNYALFDYGSIWREPILQSVQVNFIRLPCANQTPIRGYAPNRNGWMELTCTTPLCWNTISIRDNAILSIIII